MSCLSIELLFLFRGLFGVSFVLLNTEVIGNTFVEQFNLAGSLQSRFISRDEKRKEQASLVYHIWRFFYTTSLAFVLLFKKDFDMCMMRWLRESNSAGLILCRHYSSSFDFLKLLLFNLTSPIRSSCYFHLARCLLLLRRCSLGCIDCVENLVRTTLDKILSDAHAIRLGFFHCRNLQEIL